MKSHFNLRLAASCAIMPMLLAGCVDDSYDLENINTDIEVKVNELVVPINLDEITLSSVFDLKDDSAIKEGANGEYAVIIDGEFSSDPIHINAVTINPGSIQPITSNILKYEGTGVNLPPISIGEQSLAYEITEAVTDFSFSSTQIDKSIRSLEKIKGDWNIDITIKVQDDNSLFSSLGFQKLVLQLPAGFHTSSYPCNNGMVSIGDLNLSQSTTTSVTVKIDEIDISKFSAGEYSFTPASGNSNNGTISLSGKIGVATGYLVGKTNKTSSNIPQQVVMVTTPKMAKINVSSVTGTIGFAIDNFDAQDADINDLPDFLNDDNTHITLSNPQLYFGLNNPVAGDKLNAVTGLQLDSYKNGTKVNSCSLDNNGVVKLGYDKGVAGPYNFCLSPKNPASYYGDYSGAEYVAFTSLSQLLEGDGLPSKISVNFLNPRIPDSHVTDFKVGRDIAGIKGDYTFYAPLQFGAGSQVIYSESETGWNDETIEKINIKELHVTALATNNLPFDITLSGIPLDVDGNPCKDPNTGQTVKIEGFTVKAGAVQQPVTLRTVGTIKGLDGIEYQAKAEVTTPGEPLKSTMPIKLEDIRVKVSGNYIDTL